MNGTYSSPFPRPREANLPRKPSSILVMVLEFASIAKFRVEHPRFNMTI
jgi:hypothetical protein